MSLLIETIRLENGEFLNLLYHESRMLHSLNRLYGRVEEFSLKDFLSEQKNPTSGLYKCRIEYDDTKKLVEFLPYKPRKVNSLKLVYNDHVSYDYKYKDRQRIDKLLLERDGCDDIIIVKRKMITDASFANIVFKKDDKWYTPCSALLRGTMRQYLLDNNKIIEENIHVGDLPKFESCKLINAMLQFDASEIEISNIIL